VRYPGGKGKCFQQVINLLPAHETYMETHLGGGAVLRHKTPAKRSIGIDLDARVVASWQEAFPNLATYLKADAIEVLTSWNFRGDEVVYCDPPYLAQTRKRKRIYRCEYSDEDHIRLIATLRKLPCFVVLSGYPSGLYDELLRGWNTVEFSAKTHAETRTERLWFNYTLPAHLHDGSYLGKSFRERQTVKRRLVRLQDRIACLPATEKCEVHKWLCQHLEKEENIHARLLFP
jgi:site-specific DNA-adenine methylase